MTKTPRARLVALLVLVAGCPKPPSPVDAGADAGRERFVCEGCTILVAAHLFDGTTVHDGGQVAIRDGGVVARLDPDTEVIGAVERIDFGDATILPGLIDLHVHLLLSGAPYGDRSEAPPEVANLKALLRRGVTTVLDLGNRRAAMVDLRERIRSGQLLGPRVLIAGSFITPPGGHPCYAGNPPEDGCVLVERASAARQALEPLLAVAPDVLKIVVESGTPQAPLPRMSLETERAVAAIASSRGLRVFAHLTHTEEVEQSLDAGVVHFAHLVSRDELPAGTVATMAEANAAVIPTLSAWAQTLEISRREWAWLDDFPADIAPSTVAALRNESFHSAFFFTAAYQAFLQAEVDRQRLNFIALRAGGVRIAAGTDCGVPAVPCGVSMSRELERYVAWGMGPLEALASATSVAANVVDRPDLGRLTAGASADVLVVRGDATTTVSALEDVEAVFLGGRRIDRDALDVRRNTSLVAVPTSARQAGTTCLFDEDCLTAHLCPRYQRECLRRCDGGTCPRGSSCVSLRATERGCLPSEGCDLVTQSCENGAACVVLGNGGTVCAPSGVIAARQVCTRASDCQRGAQCDVSTRLCRAFCAPAPEPPTCDATEQCLDLSSFAGQSAGWCR